MVKVFDVVLSYAARNLLADRLRRLFGGKPCAMQAAALPWRRNEDGVEILLITSRGTGRWVLPKGWPERGEQLCDAALREAEEEAGVVGTVRPVEAGQFFYEKALRSGAEKRCEVKVFPLEVNDLQADWPERKERNRRWFSPTEAGRAVAEPDLGELISAFRG